MNDKSPFLYGTQFYRKFLSFMSQPEMRCHRIGICEGVECHRCGSRHEIIIVSINGDVCADCLSPEELAKWRLQICGPESSSELT